MKNFSIKKIGFRWFVDGPGLGAWFTELDEAAAVALAVSRLRGLALPGLGVGVPGDALERGQKLARAMSPAFGEAAPPVLVVDDDASNRRLFCKLLRQNGHETHGAATAAEAIAWLRSREDVCHVYIDLEGAVRAAILDELEKPDLCDRVSVVCSTALEGPAATPAQKPPRVGLVTLLDLVRTA